NHSGAHRGVGGQVNQDETAGRSVARVGVEEQRCVRLELQTRDFVHLQALTRFFCQSVDVDTMKNADRLDLDLACGLLEKVGGFQSQRSRLKPNTPGAESSGDLRQVMPSHEHVASAEINFVLQTQSNRHR